MNDMEFTMLLSEPWWKGDSNLIRVRLTSTKGLVWLGICHMESRGLRRLDLEPYLGSRARVAEVLNRRRSLTIDMIRKLHAGLGISAEVLIRPYAVRGSAA